MRRPLGMRHAYCDDPLIARRRHSVMRHMLAGTNLGLVFMRQAALDDDCAPFIASRRMVDARSFYSNKGIVNLAPLYIYLAELELDKRL